MEQTPDFTSGSAVSTEELPLLCAVVTPGTLGRLCKCCRVFRTIFSTEGIWLSVCKEIIGKDTHLKLPSQLWRDFYADWVLSARAWFTAYSRLALQFANDTSFGMHVQLGGEGLPEEWNGHTNLSMSDINFTEFGISADLNLHWSDSEGYASLPQWTYKNSGRISRITIVASTEQASSSTVLEVDCADSGLRALDFARSDFVKCSGIKVAHSCYCEGDERECCDYGEDLSISVRIPIVRLLVAMLGPSGVRKSAATFLGLSYDRCNECGQGLMLFAELRSDIPYSDNRAEALPVTTIVSKVPCPSWYNPQHAFRFRRLYWPLLQEWKQENDLPMPGFKFSFEFPDMETTTRDYFYTSFCCLDSVGNVSFGVHLVRCDTRRKFLCLTEAQQRVTPVGNPRYFLAKLEPHPGPRVPSFLFGQPVGQNPGVATLNFYMVPFNRIPGFERNLTAVYKDYCACLLHRWLCLKHPEGAQVTQLEVAQRLCESDSLLQIIERLCNGPLEDCHDGVMSDDSDSEEEATFWKNDIYCGQEKLIEQIRESVEFQPATWISFEGGERKETVLTEADRPQVQRRSNKGSVWLGRGSLKRCKLCRCILTGLHRTRAVRLAEDDSDDDFYGSFGKLYRDYCFKCDKLADKARRLQR